jgi:acyl-CoA thioester hydrolase
MRASGYVWPVIDLQLRYAQAAQFGQRLVVRAELVEWENRLKINYLIREAASGQRLTRASSVQVAVCMQSREMQLTSPAALVDAVQRKLDLDAPEHTA